MVSNKVPQHFLETNFPMIWIGAMRRFEPMIEVKVSGKWVSLIRAYMDRGGGSFKLWRTLKSDKYNPLG
jgi:hypothetical protein